jgi:hypothetical protein
MNRRFGPGCGRGPKRRVALTAKNSIGTKTLMECQHGSLGNQAAFGRMDRRNLVLARKARACCRTNRSRRRGPDDSSNRGCRQSARETLAALTEKLAESDRLSIELATEAESIALAAFTGDDAARRRLDKLNSQRTAHGLEATNLKAAIRRQEAVVAEAERAEARAAAAANPKEVVAVAERFATRGKAIDAAFAAARAELLALYADANELHRLGVRHPRHEQISANGSLAIVTHLMSLPFKVERDHLAAREHKDFDSLCSGWADSIARGAAPFLVSEAAAK